MKADTVADALVRAHGRYSGEFLDAITWPLMLDENKRPQTVAEWRRRILGDLAEVVVTEPDLLIDEFGAGTHAAADEHTASEPLKTILTAPPTVAVTVSAIPRITGSATSVPTASLDTQDISKFLERRDEIERAVKAKFQRVLTVMFTDLKGSTAIAEASGDIAVRAMLKRYHDLCLIAVNRHGGTLVKTIGDGSLSHFEAATTACRAATDIQRGMEEINLSKRYKTTLLARIGIHTGECILEKNDIFGDVVNTASRFESSANPGEILISEDTYNALSDKSEFYARYDREVTLKGKSMPFKTYIVFWDPKEVERDMNRPTDAPGSKKSTPAWKIALYIAVPLLLILSAALWITSGEKFSGETHRSIDHALPGSK
jgi:class 3 adenylate cyclase